MENYSSNTDDSITKYKSENGWYKRFLIYSIKKAFNVLAVGGHIIIYIAESRDSRYIDKMIHDVNKFMKYKGNIYYYYPEKKDPDLRGFYVWKKLYDINPNFHLIKYENIDIICDNTLIAGTKQRVLIDIIKKLGKSFNIFTVILDKYYNDGLTLAYACHINNKKSHIYFNDIHLVNQEILDNIRKYGGTVYDGFDRSQLYGEKVYNFNLGLNDDIVHKGLMKRIRFVLGTTFNREWIEKYDEVWIPSDTGLSNILDDIFIRSKIVSVANDTPDNNSSNDSNYYLFETWCIKSWLSLIGSNRHDKKILFWSASRI